MPSRPSSENSICSNKMKGGRSPPRFEKIFEHPARGIAVAGAFYLRAMMTSGLLEKARAMQYRSALGILGREDQTTYPRQGDGAGAHRARLQRDEQLRGRQPLIA